MDDFLEFLIEFVFTVLTSSARELGYMAAGLVTLVVGVGVSETWPFGGTPNDVMTGYMIVVMTLIGGVLAVRWFFRSIN